MKTSPRYYNNIKKQIPKICCKQKCTLYIRSCQICKISIVDQFPYKNAVCIRCFSKASLYYKLKTILKKCSVCKVGLGVDDIYDDICCFCFFTRNLIEECSKCKTPLCESCDHTFCENCCKNNNKQCSNENHKVEKITIEMIEKDQEYKNSIINSFLDTIHNN